MPENDRHQKAGLPKEHERILEKLLSVYRDLFLHDGYGTLCVKMRFLKKGQKEIVIECGKEYRYVVDAPTMLPQREGDNRGAEQWPLEEKIHTSAGVAPASK